MTAAVVARIVALDEAIESLGEVSRSTRALITRLTGPLELAVSHVMRAGEAVATLSKNINEFLLPPIEFAAKQIGSLTTGTASYGAEIRRAAQLTQLGVERYQELRYAAGKAGVAQDTLTEALVSMNGAARSARSGNDELIRRFTALSLSTQELQDLAPDQLFLRIIDALRGIDDPVLQRDIASAILGRIAPQLARLVEDGSAGIERSAQQAHDLGNVLDTNAIVEADSFKSQLDLLSSSFNGLALTIGSRLLPVLQPLIDKLTLWISANRDLIATKIEEVIGKIAAAIEDIDFDHLFEGLVGVVDGVGKLIEKLGGWKVTALALLGLLSEDKDVAGLAVMGATISAFRKKLSGEPSTLDVAQESLTNLFEDLQENRKRYGTASPTERGILDKQFQRKLSEAESALDVMERETTQVPSTILRQFRNVQGGPVPNPRRQELDKEVEQFRNELNQYKLQFPEPTQPRTGNSTIDGQSRNPALDKGQLLRGALDVNVYVNGEPTRVSITQRPDSNLDLAVIYRGKGMVLV
jgi:hypothetical protein